MAGAVNNRLEASTRGTDLLPGLHASIHDALWLLARQWQLGEFDGTDSGSPISAAIATRSAPLSSWTPRSGAAQPYQASCPLEALVESDGGPLPWTEKVSAGLRLIRLLRRAGLDPHGLTAAHPLDAPDPAVDPDADPAAHASSAVTPAEVASVAAVYAARLPDADAVAAAFDSSPDGLVAAAGGEPARPVLANWRAWWARKASAPVGAWQQQELSYAFTAATSDAELPVYAAERFPGGALDWYAFDLAPGAGAPGPAAGAVAPAAGAAGAPGAAAAAATAAITRAVPVPVTFHGSPVGRYWQLEDASIDYGGLDVYPTELGKLLLAEFTACYAGNWFRLPVRVPYGSAIRVDAVVSSDTFGIQTLVPAASAAGGERPWRMYEHTSAAGTSADGSWLLVPPVLAAAMESAPVEEVVLVRDPAADLAWGIEHIVTNAVGRPVRRSEDLRAQGRVPDPDPRGPLPDTWVWRLATTVAENWIPFLPTPGRAPGEDYLLVQGSMIRYVRTAAGGLQAVTILPASLQLRAGGTIPEREIPREGVSLRRVRKLTRWVDGSRCQWFSRVREVGHGEASSGLAYDRLDAPGGPVSA